MQTRLEPPIVVRGEATNKRRKEVGWFPVKQIFAEQFAYRV